MMIYSVPFVQKETVEAVMSVSVNTTAVASSGFKSQVLDPLMEARLNIEHALDFISGHETLGPNSNRDYKVSL